MSGELFRKEVEWKEGRKEVKDGELSRGWEAHQRTGTLDPVEKKGSYNRGLDLEKGLGRSHRVERRQWDFLIDWRCVVGKGRAYG